CADLGQGEDLKAVKAKALQVGASKVSIEDLRETFVLDYIFRMLRANAVYEGSYLLGTAIARPLIAKRQIEIAEREGTDAVAHGATGKGNDQVRFEVTYLALNPSVKIIAPWREWEFRSRRELIEYAQRHGIPVTATKAKPYSTDQNLFHVSYEGGILEDPWEEAPEEIFQTTVSPERAPAKPVYDGYWHTPEREMLQAAVDDAQKDVTGTARVKLYKGTCCTAGRRAARSLYRLDMATFEEDDVYRQKDAEGFIRLNALRLAIRASRRKTTKRKG